MKPPDLDWKASKLHRCSKQNLLAVAGRRTETEARCIRKRPAHFGGWLRSALRFLPGEAKASRPRPKAIRTNVLEWENHCLEVDRPLELPLTPSFCAVVFEWVLVMSRRFCLVGRVNGPSSLEKGNLDPGPVGTSSFERLCSFETLMQRLDSPELCAIFSCYSEFAMSRIIGEDFLPVSCNPSGHPQPTQSLRRPGIYGLPWGW